MNYVGRVLQKEFTINKIFSIHYYEYNKDFSYSGEAHDFWEMVYVDKGTIDAIAGDTKHNLIKGDIIFHKPNEFHDLTANGRIAPNLIVISFSCRSPGIKWFNNRILHIGNEEKNLLAGILHEAGNAFSSKLNDPLLLSLQKRDSQVFASEQLIKLYLEQFLIGLIRRELHLVVRSNPASPLNEKTGKNAFNRVISYFETNLLDMPKLSTVCRATGYSCTYLQSVFKEETGRSVMEYYKITKLEKVKELIRQGDYTFTQIASILNYSSIHYFSKIFKKHIGMTPTEYSLSVKLKL